METQLGKLITDGGWFAFAGIIGLWLWRAFAVGSKAGRIEQKVIDIDNRLARIEQALIGKGVEK